MEKISAFLKWAFTTKRKITRKTVLRFLIPQGYILCFSIIIYIYKNDSDAIATISGLMPLVFLTYNLYIALFDNE